MHCYVHVPNSVIKSAIEQCNVHPDLHKFAEDCRSVKRVVEDSKRSGWSFNLPDGYHIILDVETRFGTNCLVTERYTKSLLKLFKQ